MDLTVVVIYKGALAHYTVAQGSGNKFVAQLLTYRGDTASAPPREVSLEKSGRHCIGSVDDVAFLEELYYAAKEKLQKKV